ncbi:MAG TPA: TraB/GumN family protein [Longimicrobium sp.]|nr:TraB/GumN family protein [Longimicrobium sp.]
MLNRTTSRRLLLALTPVLLAAGACGPQAAPTRAPSVSAPASAPRHMLYRVEGRGGATVYLLGSIHLLTADVYPLAQPIEAAYADAERVWFEADLDSLEAKAPQMINRGLLTGGRTLRTELPADVYAVVQQAAQRAGIDMNVLDRLEPWLAGLLLAQTEYQRAGLQAEHGIDRHFAGRARQDQKPRGGLESVEFQMGLFDGFTREQQVEFLRSSLEDLSKTGEMMGVLKAAWLAGDEAAIDSLMNDSMDHPELMARLLTDRNRAWVPQIEQMLQGTDDVLVVVGAAHLVGQNSVVRMLRDKGWRVEQL